MAAITLSGFLLHSAWRIIALSKAELLIGSKNHNTIFCIRYNAFLFKLTGCMFVNINKKLDGILSASIIVAGILSANIVTANNLNYSLGAYNDFYSEISNHANKNVNYRVARSTSMDRGFKINGYTADDYSGYSVSNAGDVNGDGLSDVIIGSYRDANSYKGKSFVVFGKTTGASVNLDSTLSGFTINGEYNSYSGWSVSGAGDVNGDRICLYSY
jgi:hypothetical protein